MIFNAAFRAAACNVHLFRPIQQWMSLSMTYYLLDACSKTQVNRDDFIRDINSVLVLYNEMGKFFDKYVKSTRKFVPVLPLPLQFFNSTKIIMSKRMLINDSNRSSTGNHPDLTRAGLVDVHGLATQAVDFLSQLGRNTHDEFEGRFRIAYSNHSCRVLLFNLDTILCSFSTHGNPNSYLFRSCT